MVRAWIGDRREAVGLSLLRIAAISHRERIDLAPLVANLSLEHRGASRRRFRSLANRLNSGATLIDALEQTPDLLSDEEVLRLRFAYQSGTVSQTYEELIDEASHRVFAFAARPRQSLMYGVVLSLVFACMIAFLMTFIAPTFRQMFNEFGLALPSLLQSLIATVNIIAEYLPLLVLLAVVLIAGCWLFKPLRSLHRWIASRIFPSVAQLRRSELWKMLAQSIEAGRPIPGSISTLARYHFDKAVRMKLLFARNEVEQGTETWDSLREANLLSSEASSAFRNASTPKLQSWTLRRLARQQETEVRQRRALLTMLIEPAIVLVFGAITLWVTVAFFSVLVSMISALA